ncbi:MAG: rRNA pseudouridine synthase [Lachnospiraceae bacterium]|nr:rRNA pseudouridine synthase [Lachnospiraceae bacterium]
MRLDKYLADMNAGTRSELKRDIRKGLVTVGGSVVKDPGRNVEPLTDTVCYRGRKIKYETYVYYMLNKPAGVISATDDKKMQTVVDLLPEERRRDIFPVGRLDKDTEGLLLITNNGELAHRLLSPKYHVDKKYFARIRGRVTDEDVRAFARGIPLEDFTCMPADLVIEKSGETSEITVTIREGKFHQIKRMFEAVDKEVIYLKRLEMGSLILDSELAPGEFRRLTEEELRSLSVLAGLSLGSGARQE